MNGATVQVWDCHGGPNQQWSWDRDRSAIVSASGKCLAVRPSDMGSRRARVTVWDCSGNPNQAWQRNGQMLVNAAGLCLSVPPGQTQMNGGQVTLWDCTGSPNQQWSRRHMAPPPPPPMQPSGPVVVYPQQPPPGPMPAMPMPPHRFQKLLEQVQGLPFQNEKLARIRDYLSPDTMFTTAQIGQLMTTTAFGSERITIAALLWPRVVDPENFPDLVALLTCESERRELRRKLGR